MADMNRAVLLFPGQGSQYVGMGRSFFGASLAVARLFEEAADVTGIDFRQLCFEGPDATLLQTDNVQPAITLVNVAAFTMLRGLTPAMRLPVFPKAVPKPPATSPASTCSRACV